jgi:hypothetical protein
MKHSYKQVIALALVVLASVSAWAQAGGGDLPAASGRAGYGIAEARRDYRQLSLTAEEAARIRAALDKGLRDVEMARAEIRELQARLARQMLEARPDMEAIRSTVRASLEAEFRVRMTQIERNLAIRDIIGDRRWAALSRLSRTFVALSRDGDLRLLAERAGDAETLSLLFEILKTLQ